MTDMRKVAGSVVVAAALGILGGCATYYVVKDPASGKTYFTREFDQIKGGAVKFTDDRTGNMVTIQNSEIREVNKNEYNSGRNIPE